MGLTSPFRQPSQYLPQKRCFITALALKHIYSLSPRNCFGSFGSFNQNWFFDKLNSGISRSWKIPEPGPDSRGLKSRWSEKYKNTKCFLIFIKKCSKFPSKLSKVSDKTSSNQLSPKASSGPLHSSIAQFLHIPSNVCMFFSLT